MIEVINYQQNSQLCKIYFGQKPCQNVIIYITTMDLVLVGTGINDKTVGSRYKF